MDLFLDDTLVARGIVSLADAIREARILSAESHRLIVAVHVDGQPVPDDQLELPSEEPSAAGHIRFTTAAIGDVAREAAAEISIALDAARQAQERCAALILSGEVERAVKLLASVVEQWQRVRTGVEACTFLLEATPPTLRLDDGGTLADRLASLRSGLEEVKRALRAEDWSALGDVLHHEMSHEAASWNGIVGTLIARAEA